MQEARQSVFRTVFGMMINPAGTLKAALLSTKWFYSLIVSALAFGLFFAQTGLDLYKTGQKPLLFVVLTAGIGVTYGLLIIPLLGVLNWILLKVTRSTKSLKEAVTALCLSYSSALIYGLLGLVFSLTLGWKTAIAFGVTGVLWATGPIMVSLREFSDGRSGLSIVLATITSVTVLWTWSLFGQM